LFLAPRPTDSAEAGFTVIEVLIALAVVAVCIVAIGSVMATNVRGVRSVERHVELMQMARTALATAMPRRADLQPGTLSGQIGDYRWRVDVGELGGDWAAPDADATWIPELVTVHVQSPTGAAMDVRTVRLMRGQQQ
jgi:general secretion pathway protein I